jgi:enoyl-CoA hydratase/carnithine racemase
MPDIDLSIKDKILTITINRPSKKNALTQNMYTTMADAISSAEENRSIHVIFIRGTQGCFSSGNDLKDFLSMAQGPMENLPVGRFLSTISSAKKPIVAAVEGPAVGIGTTMLLHCDIVFADQNARFQLPFVNLALCAEGASSYLLPNMAGHQKAAELLLLGEAFSSTQAKEIGFVNHVCANDAVLDEGLACARKLSEKPLTALTLIKSQLKRNDLKKTQSVLKDEFLSFREMLASPEAKEALAAFFEPRGIRD